MEKAAATYVGLEDPKALRASKNARNSRFGMPLGLIKVDERIQKECLQPKSDYVCSIGSCLRLAVGAFSAQNYRLPPHIIVLPWKKNRMRTHGRRL